AARQNQQQDREEGQKQVVGEQARKVEDPVVADLDPKPAQRLQPGAVAVSGGIVRSNCCNRTEQVGRAGGRRMSGLDCVRGSCRILGWFGNVSWRPSPRLEAHVGASEGGQRSCEVILALFVSVALTASHALAVRIQSVSSSFSCSTCLPQ